MVRKPAYRAVLAAVALASAGSALAQATNTANASASITIAHGITVTKNVDLAFGRCVAPTAAGMVSVAALTDARTTSGVTCPPNTATRFRLRRSRSTAKALLPSP